MNLKTDKYPLKKIANLPVTIVAAWLLLTSLVTAKLQAQQPVRVNITVMQPVTPYLPQLQADITGGRYANAEGLLTDKLIITLTNSSQSTKRVKLSARIERLSPTPAAVYLRPDYQPAAPITLSGGQMVRLDRPLIEEAFGNFSRSKLVFENLNLSALRQNAVNYKLPEGIYRICVTAYDYDKPGQSAPVSQIGVGCAIFTICYTASAPQFTMPVSGFMGKGRDFGVYTPTSPQIQFAWTPPATTCGLSLGMVTYDLEIKELFAGQVLSDAKRNPFVFRRQNIPTNMFLLDTLLYPNVFQKGKRYTIQVKANIQKIASSPLEIANQGYSERATLTYQPKAQIETSGRLAGVKTPPAPPLPGGLLPGGGTGQQPGNLKLTSGTLQNACENIEPVTDKTASTEDITGKDLTIGGFTLHVDEASALTEGGFKGKGTIEWAPFGAGLKTLYLLTSFDNIQVNSAGQVFSGAVNTVTDGSIPDWATLTVPGNIPGAGAVKDATDAINRVANPISNIAGNTRVNFPLGLDEANIASTQSSLAIMSIQFTPVGTDMRVLFNMDIPDAAEGSQWLSMVATNLCIKPDGFSAEKGLLLLPEDRTIPMSNGYQMTFKKSFDPVSNTIDTTDKTYLLWSPENGLDRVVVNGELQLGAEDLAVIKPDGSFSNDRFTMNIKFDFKNWSDWLAAITPTTDFGIRSMPGFKLSAKDGLWYDHSNTRNPNALTAAAFPNIYTTKGWATDASYQGVFMKDLQLTLPDDFIGVGGKNATVDFNNLFIDDHGLSTIISANDVLDAGSLGGWWFSIDKIFVAIEASNPTKDMQMAGRVGLPISNDRLLYTCTLNSTDSKINYELQVTPPASGLNVPIWGATFMLNKDSRFTINKDAHGMAVLTELAGKLDINVKEPIPLSFTAVTFRDMTIGNRDAAGKEGFDFFPGHIDFGTDNSSSSTALLNPNWQRNGGASQHPYPAYAMRTGGPSDAVDIPYGINGFDGAAETASKKTVSSFGATVDGFKPVVKFGDPNGVQIGFSFDVGLDLGFGNSDVIAGKALGIKLLGAIDTKNWKPVPNSLTLTPPEDGVEVKGEISNVVKVDGHIQFMHDATWGDGIDGGATVTFIPGITVQARVIFGKNDEFDYFGFGASLYKKSGLVPIGPIIINGFGGGYYHNLTMDTIPKAELANLPATQDINNYKFKPSPGSTTLMANLALSYISSSVLKANVTFIAALSKGKVDSLMLLGAGDILSDGEAASTGTVHVDLKMRYDFVHDQFDMFIGPKVKFFVAKADIPIWIHAGKKSGVGSEGGKDKSNFDFFLYLGHPGTGNTSSGYGEAYRRIQLTLIDLKTSLLKVHLGATGYLCIGSTLPDFPDLPPTVANFLGYNVSAKSNSNKDLISKIMKEVDGGFMLGAEVNGSVDLDLAVIRAYATALMGFDVAMVHTLASNCTPDGSLMGFNGWYAIGQIYAYLKMGVDLHIDVGLFDFDVTLAKVEVGAALRGGMPNPIWMNGRVRVVGEALGGTVHVDKTFTMEVNKPCFPASDPLENLKMIAEIGPSEQDVSVFATPYIVFNIPMNNSNFPITTMDENGEDEIRVFRFNIIDLQTKRDGTTESQRQLKFSTDGYTCYMVSDAILKPKASYSITVTCQAKEQLANGKWVDPINKEGKPEVRQQSESGSFKTASAPNVIDEKHVVISYPLNGQRYFLRNEFQGKKGAVVLDIQNPEYFTLENTPNPVRKAVFVPQDGGPKIERRFTVQNYGGKQRLEFDIPGTLKPSTIYLLFFSIESPESATEQQKKTTQLLDLEKNGKSRLSRFDKMQRHSTGRANPVRTTNQMTEDDMGVSLKTVTKSVTGKLIDPEKISFPEGVHGQGKEIMLYQPKIGRNIYQMAFRTSQFGTFKEKMASFGNTIKPSSVVESGTARDGLTAASGNKWQTTKLTLDQGPEGFDQFEIIGTTRKVGEGAGRWTYHMPPLLNPEQAFEPNKANDRDMDPLYRTGFKLALGIAAFNIDFGAPEVRTLAEYRPDYTIRTDKTSFAAPMDINQFLKGNSGQSNQDLFMGLIPIILTDASSNRLSLIYERDKYFANDLAIVRGAWYKMISFNKLKVNAINEFETLKTQFKAAIIVTAVRHPNYTLSIIDKADRQALGNNKNEAFWSKAFRLMVDKVNSYSAEELRVAVNKYLFSSAGEYNVEHDWYKKYITNATLLYQGKYGSVTIPDGRAEWFWLNYGLLKSTFMNLIEPLQYSPLPKSGTHYIKFHYGLSFEANRRQNHSPIPVFGGNYDFTSSSLSNYFKPLYGEEAIFNKQFKLQ